MKQSASTKANIILSLSLLAAFGIFMIIRSGRFNKEPEVLVKADNCYTETLKVISDEDYRPYSFINSKGDFSGHDVELIILIANELHMNLDLTFMNWNKAIEAMGQGQADVLMTCDYSDSFAGVEKLKKSEPVSTDDFIIYSKKKISSSNAIYGNRIAIMKNGNVTNDIKKMHLQDSCILYENNREAMKALINDEVDYAVMRQTVGTVLLRELKARNIHGFVSIGLSDMCFGVDSADRELLERINNALETLKINGTLDQLQKKWLTTFIRPYTISEVLQNNYWVTLVILILVVFILTLAFRDYRRSINQNEEKLRNARVVEWLTQDFGCVNYILLTDDPQRDPVINYRISEKLKELIPGWENERYFSHKLDLLCENLVYEPDKKQFNEDTLRTKVIKAVNEAGVYFVNTRLYFDDEIRYYQMKFSPVYENMKLKALVAGVHSVDKQTKKEMALQEQLQDALTKAEVANKAKTEFLFNMSHDIRTPLNAIAGFTSMAIKHIDNKEKALDCLKKTQKSGNLLLTLINSVLDVSRIESGNATVEQQCGDVMYSFINIETTMRELASAKNIDLTFEFGEIKDRYVLCDFSRCNRVFVNIISNAIKYTKEGGYIKVKCEQVGESRGGCGTYRYTFTDNGIGMSEEFQKQVFEKFTRERNVTLSGIQGTGLGMAVCKSFVELMNGHITCESKLGEGTTFIVTLPFTVRSEEKYTDLVTGEVRDSRETTEDRKRDFRGKHVLLTEDNELNREIAVDILSDEGMVVESVGDGTEAIAVLKQRGPDFFDFILMDIQMPVMDGYEATKKIRELFPEQHVPIIALSANAFAEDKATSLAAGMDGHVAKPIEITALFKALSRFL